MAPRRAAALRSGMRASTMVENSQWLIGRGRSAFAWYLLVLCALALGIPAGCAVGPNFKPPAAPANGGFTPAGSTPQTVTASTPDPGGEAQRFVDGLDIPGQWWTLFQSPELNALIDRALKQNPTLESAQAALREANENVAAERGALLPSLSGTYEAQRNRGSLAEIGLGTGGYYYTLNSANVSVSYTLDAFGGIRRQIEALQAQADYARFSLEASYLTLTSQCGHGRDHRSVAAGANRGRRRTSPRAQQPQLDITQRRVTAGGASRTDVLQQQADPASDSGDACPRLRTQLAQQRDLLADLRGRTARRVRRCGIQLDSLTLPVDLPVSLPSKFVEQRPDVRQYSALLHQATAQIGVATANMLPQLTSPAATAATPRDSRTCSRPPRWSGASPAR